MIEPYLWTLGKKLASPAAKSFDSLNLQSHANCEHLRSEGIRSAVFQLADLVFAPESASLLYCYMLDNRYIHQRLRFHCNVHHLDKCLLDSGVLLRM